MNLFLPRNLYKPMIKLLSELDEYTLSKFFLSGKEIELLDDLLGYWYAKIKEEESERNI